MGKPTGFLEFDRKEAVHKEPLERIRDFQEFKKPLSLKEQQKQGARCMECGVPFCQSGMMIAGMASGCPLHNLVPETNDLVYRLRHTVFRNLPAGYARLCVRRPAPVI